MGFPGYESLLVYFFCFWLLLLTSTLDSKLWLSSKQQKFYLFSKSSPSHKKKKTNKQEPPLHPSVRLLVGIRFPIPIYPLLYSLILLGKSCLKVEVWRLPQVVLNQYLQRLSWNHSKPLLFFYKVHLTVQRIYLSVFSNENLSENFWYFSSLS